MDTREKGRKYEDVAADYINSHGGRVLDRNFFFKGGEIDLIAMDTFFNQEYLCFIEVKARKDTSKGHPLEAITKSKRDKIIKGAKTYLNYKKYPKDTNIRFDAIAILDSEITWEKNAFSLY